MLGNHVVVGDFADHLDVVLLLALRELGLQHHEEVVPVLVLVHRALCKGRHLTRSQVDPALDVAGPVVEQKHIGVVLASEVFEPADDGDSVEALSLEGGVVSEVAVELVDGEGDDGSVVDGLVLLFARILHLALVLII